MFPNTEGHFSPRIKGQRLGLALIAVSGKKAKPLSWAESELWKLGTVGPSRGAGEQGVGSWVLSLAWDLVLTPAETRCFLRGEASSDKILWGRSMLRTGLERLNPQVCAFQESEEDARNSSLTPGLRVFVTGSLNFSFLLGR